MMGCAVVISSVLRTLFCSALLNSGWKDGFRVTWATDTDGIFMGIVLVVLGEVFRRGYAMKTESELTV
jgi:hypothetical protein